MKSLLLSSLLFVLGTLPAFAQDQMLTNNPSNQMTDYVQVGNMGAFPDHGAVSFALRASVVENYRNVLTTGCISDCNIGIRFEEGSDGSLNYNIGNDGGSLTGAAFMAAGTFLPNVWHHVVLTWDKPANNVKTYVDGILKTNLSCTFWPTQLGNVNLGIGYGQSRKFAGNLDAVTLWTRTLTLAEAQSLNAGTVNPSDLDLKGYWNFDDNTTNGAGQTVLNEAINFVGQYDGTTVGTASTPVFEPSTWVPTLPPQPPTISSISPASGHAGASATVTGTDLNNGLVTVTVGGIAATNVSVLSATEVSFNTPVTGEGEDQAVVVTVGGQPSTETVTYDYELWDIHSVGSGLWHNASTWDCNCEPNQNDNIRIEPGHTISENCYCPHTVSGQLIVDGTLDCTYGFTATSTAVVSGIGTVQNGGTINTSDYTVENTLGTMTFNQPVSIENYTIINSNSGGLYGTTVTINGTFNYELRPGHQGVWAPLVIASGATMNLTSAFPNHGLCSIRNGMTNNGTVNMNGGIEMDGNNGSGTNQTMVNNGTWNQDVNCTYTRFLFENNGAFNMNGTGLSDMVGGTPSFQSTFHNNAGGTLKVTSGTLKMGPFTNAGTVKGNGTLEYSAAVTNTGHFAPGLSPGTMDIVGNFTNAVLDMEIVAGSPVQKDSLSVTGNLVLTGSTLNVTAAECPADGSYDIITYTGTRTGDFATLTLPSGFTVTYDDGAKKVVLVVDGCEIDPDNDGDNFTVNEGDCDDNDPDEFPGQTWYIDADGDDYGGAAVTQCLRPTNGYLLSDLVAGSSGTDDCNDNCATCHPGATEICGDGLDNDCDGQTDGGPDFAALMALYNSTDGPNWTYNMGWADGAAGTNCDVCGWYGVTCDGNGRVTDIVLQTNNLTGPLPTELGDLAQLTQLELGVNQLSGSIPASLENLGNLQYLGLGANQLTGAIPTFLGDLGNLQSLALYFNQLTGSIPTSLGGLSNLTELNLFSNQLSGGIPPELGDLGNLSSLELGDNQLSGNIPLELDNLSNLASLNLGNNQLSGSISPGLGSLTNLLNLYLNDNLLTGSIPPELGNLSNLIDLWLDHNQLTGSIPPVLGDMTNLYRLYLNDNQLSGCFPSNFTNFCSSDCNFSNNPGLPGGGDFAAFCADGTGECASDMDGDGYASPDDCDDNDDTIYPGATELCDNLDNDCNGQTDEAPPLTVTISGNLSICAGQSTTLTASPGATYLWNTGATTASISASAAGTYSVTVNGCPANTASATVVVNPVPQTSGMGISICPNDNNLLVAFLPARVTNGVPSDFTWAFTDNPNVTGEANGSGDLFYAPLGNTTGTLQSVFYAITPTAEGSGCVGPDFSIQVNLWPMPDITCPTDIDLSTAAGLCSASQMLTHPALVTDNLNCPATLSIAFTAGSSAPSALPTSGAATPSGTTAYTFAKGQTTITYTALDGAGNEDVCSFTVTVADTEKPVITCPADQTVDADGNCQGSLGTYVLVFKNDNCTVSGNITESQSPDSEVVLTGHNTAETVTLTADDGNGNTETCSFTVTLKDVTEPLITCDEDQTIAADGTCSGMLGDWRDWTSSLSDDCATPTVTQSPTANTTLSGHNTAQTVTLTATDDNGNTETCTFTVTLKDVTPPIIACPADQTVAANGACSGTVGDLTALATGLSDNCATTITVTQSPAENTPLSGHNDSETVTFTADDGNGNTETCSFTVTLKDVTPPNAQCQAVAAQIQPNGQATITVADADNNSTDNCGIAMRSLSQTVFTCANVGEPTLVTLAITDMNFQVSTCNATVTITDVTKPTITCPADKTVAADGTCSGTVDDHRGLATNLTDNCATTITLTQSPSENTTLNGHNDAELVTLTADDGNGNTEFCTFTVTLKDVTKPTITCPADQTVSADGTCGGTVGDRTALATDLSDNCATTPSVTQSPAANTPLSGHNDSETVTLTADDGNGNTEFCTFTVTLQDVTKPTITCPANLTVAADGTCSGTVGTRVLVSKNDNCTASGSITESQSPASGTVLSGHNDVKTVTLSATDNNGNTETCTFTVTLKDVIKPVITCPTNISKAADQGVCTSAVTYSVTATDNCTASGSIALVRTNGLASGSTFPGGTSTVNWKATDAVGNTTTCAFTVTITDGQMPSITCPANIAKNTDPGLCSAVVTYANPIFSDNCSGTSIQRTSGQASGTAFAKGTHSVNWQATDAAGLVAVCNFTVTVNDQQIPTITCPANMTRSTDAGLCTAVVNYTTPTATDNCAGVTVACISGLAPNSVFPKGTNSVTWEATDGASPANKKFCTFTVTVNDTQLPTITCPANQTKSTDAGLCTAVTNYTTPTFTDNCAGGSVAMVSGLASGSAFPKGNTTVTWKATDGANLTKTCTFRVTVNDTQVPSITCPASQSVGTDVGLCSAVVAYANATFTDNCAGGTVVRTSGLASGSAFPKGTNTVVWRATDGVGLTKSCTFTVTVTDTQLPTVNCPANIAVTAAPGQCSATATYSNPTATDNCTVQSIFLLSGLPSGASFPQGVTTNTWRALDNSGGSNTCAFTVTVTCGANSSEFEDRSLKFESGMGWVEAAKDLTTRLGEVSNLDLRLTPNPATAEVQVWMENLGKKGGELTVFDARGRAVWQQSLAAGGSPSHPLTLSLLDFPSGLYFVTLRLDGIVLTKRLVVSRL